MERAARLRSAAAGGQCGKTTLAKSLLDSRGEYLNWDITNDRKVIRGLAWPKDASLVVLDELHKAPEWKNLLKGVVDEFGNKPPLLVTGSARLDSRSGEVRNQEFAVGGMEALPFNSGVT